MNYKILLLFLLCLVNLNTINATTVTGMVFSFTEEETFYNTLFNAFNVYSRENNLNIDLNINILTPDNSTSAINSYGSTVDSLLKRKSTKYDLYFYYASYTNKYGKHLLDLNEYLPQEYINLFGEEILTCSTHDNKLVGLPITVDIGTLYSNTLLLSKYKRKIPEHGMN